jgi:D-arabinose 1-dehydrogenase-like Zn-dependent alcohol dehydrogenase
MKACVLESTRKIEMAPLAVRDLPVPEPGDDDVLVPVHACGVCRTDLHVVEGELVPQRAAVTPGHQVVGTIQANGSQATRYATGARVGVPWLYSTCGACRHCVRGAENLCERAEWAGPANASPPVKLDGAIIFARAGELVPLALAALDKAGTLVLGGIHMSDVPALPYSLLYQERIVRSVANNTRQDGRDFLKVAAEAGIQNNDERFPARPCERGVAGAKADRVRGAAVLQVSDRGTERSA